jgi:hypothetical protein
LSFSRILAAKLTPVNLSLFIGTPLVVGQGTPPALLLFSR